MAKNTKKIIIWSAIGLLAGILYANQNFLSYIGGQINYPLTMIFLFIIFSCFGLVLLASAIMLLIIGFCFRNKIKAVAISSSIIGTFIVGIFAGFFVPTTFEPGAVTFLRGFKGWVSRNVDTDAIQNWIVDANESFWDYGISKDFAEVYKTPSGYTEKFPDFLVEFKPQRAYFERSRLDYSRMIEYIWGGGMFHWNLIIGEPNMAMPELMEEWYDDYDVEFRIILKPGVYVYSRG
jgi:hypothetical protein